MASPEWRPDGLEGPGMRAYAFVQRWAATHLLPHDPDILQKIHAGDRSPSTWPDGSRIPEAEALRLCELFLLNLHEAVCVPPDRSLADLRRSNRHVYRRLCLRLHPDKAGTDFRSLYAHFVVYAFVRRCYERLTGDGDIPDGWPMPPPLVTQFTPSTCDTHPPSAFEAAASAYMARHDDTSDHALLRDRIVTAHSLIEDAESAFWTAHIPSPDDNTSFPFGSFIHADDDWTAREFGTDGDADTSNDGEDDGNTGGGNEDNGSADTDGGGEDVGNDGDDNEDSGNADAPRPPRRPNAESSDPTPVDPADQVPNPPPDDLDDLGLPKARERASNVEYASDSYAVLDHLSVKQCAGMSGYSFFEAKAIPRKARERWAAAFGNVCSAVHDALEPPPPHDTARHPFHLERRVKMFLLLPFLLLRKPVTETGHVRAKSVDSAILQRLDLWCRDDWLSLVQEYERDVVALATHRSPPAASQNQRDLAKLRQAKELLARSKYSKARNGITSNGLGKADDPRVIDQMKKKHPPASSVIPPLTHDQLSYGRYTIDLDEMSKVLQGLDSDTGPGIGGLRNEHLLALARPRTKFSIPAAATAVDSFALLGTDVVAGRLPPWFYIVYTATRLVPGNKEKPTGDPDEVPDCRPINVGSAARRAWTRAYLNPLHNIYNDVTFPTQCGMEKGGITVVVAGIQLTLEQNASFAVSSLDVRNAFNEGNRDKILEALWNEPRLRGMYVYAHRLLENPSYIGMGSGTSLFDPGFRCERGVQQGAPEASFLFNLLINAANKETNEQLAEDGGSLLAIHDDTYFVGPPEAVFRAEHDHAQRLERVGLVLQPSKSRCYISPLYRDDSWHVARGATQSDDGSWTGGTKEGSITFTDDEGNSGTVYGVKVCNVPVGMDEFVDMYLRDKMNDIKEKYKRVKELLDPVRFPQPNLYIRQMLHCLNSKCLQFLGDYWLRHIDVVRTGEFCEDVDEQVREVNNIVAGVDIDAEWSEIGKKRLELPFRKKGMGYRALRDRANAQLIGGLFHDGIVRLIDRKDGEGNLWAGRLVTPVVLDALGEGSFDADSTEQWKHLLASRNQLGSVLNVTWTIYENFYQESGLAQSEGGSDMLIAQPVQQAGFYKDGRRPSKLTAALTDEIEEARYQILDQEIIARPVGDVERWAWQNGDPMVGLALENVPCPLGGLSDDAVIDTFNSTMGQKWPAARSFIGGFFGKNGQQLDAYGHNLASAPLPGAGFRILHDNVKSLMQSVMREAGFLTDVEAYNLFHGKIPSPFIEEYSTAVNRERGDRRHGSDRRICIVPDLICHNFPSADLPRHAGRNVSTAQAIFEVKTISACPTRYERARTKAVESRATGIKSEYARHVKRIDRAFAPEMTGDDGNAPGPFQIAYRTFCKGGIIPLVIGAYGETNDEFQDLLKVCARMAVARGDAVYNSPIFETEVKGGAYSVTLHLYRRALAGVIARGLSLHKRSRLHFVRGSREEAARVSEEAKSHFETGRCSEGNGFSARHSSREYGYYEQFRGFRSGSERPYQ